MSDQSFDELITDIMGTPYAEEALARLREAGYEVVPREPTEEMISAVLPYDVGEAKSRPAGKMISDVWRAMINAFHPTSSTSP